MTAYDLQTIAAAGAGLIIDARNYKAYDVQALVKKATELVIVKHAKQYSAYDCQSIAKANPGKVYFDFVD